MFQQYYYYFLFLLDESLNFLEVLWNWYVLQVHAYPVAAVSVVLSGFLYLIIMNIIRNTVCTVHEGPEIHDFIRAMRGEK